MGQRGELRGFLLNLALVLLVAGAVGLLLRWYLRTPTLPSGTPTPVASIPSNQVTSATLLKTLNDELETLDVLKLREGEILEESATVQGKTASTYRESFRLPARYTADQLAERLAQTAKPFGVKVTQRSGSVSGVPTVSLFRYSFGFDDSWTPVEITFIQTKKPRICLIIDDGGYQRGEALERLYDFKVPVTLALIPGTEFSTSLAKDVPSHGIEVICHMPMEGTEKFPKGAYPEYLKRGMSVPDVERNLQAAFDNIPGCVGLNNHMGSLASTDPQLMSAVCDWLKKRGLFFLDSRTSVATVGEKEAEKIQLAHSHRDIFLDNVVSPEKIRQQMDKLVAKAKKNGLAVGIGHFKYVTLKTMAEEVQRLQGQGIQFVYLSEAVKE